MIVEDLDLELTDDTPVPTAGDENRARVLVVAHAADGDDLALLLDALGLDGPAGSVQLPGPTLADAAEAMSWARAGERSSRDVLILPGPTLADGIDGLIGRAAS